MDKVDREHLFLLAGDDKDMVLAIVMDFKADAHRLLKECREAAESEKEQGCRAAIHTLKGSSGSLGFKMLYEECLALEKQGSCEYYKIKTVELETLVDESVRLASDLLG